MSSSYEAGKWGLTRIHQNLRDSIRQENFKRKPGWQTPLGVKVAHPKCLCKHLYKPAVISTRWRQSNQSVAPPERLKVSPQPGFYPWKGWDETPPDIGSVYVFLVCAVGVDDDELIPSNDNLRCRTAIHKLFISSQADCTSEVITQIKSKS